jgi:NitT/TauT family transport system permease protein
VIGSIIGEFVAGIGGGQGGLGYVVSVASQQLKTSYLMAAALAGGCLGVVYYVAAKILSKRLLAWHESVLPERQDDQAGWKVIRSEASGA